MMILHALMIEDSEDDSLLIREALANGGYEVRAIRVETAEDLRKALQSDHWDIILSDYSLPSFDARHALEIIQQSGMDIPVIVVSGTVGEDVAVETLKLGAEDYLLKQNLTRLVPAVSRAIELARNRRKHAKLERLKTLILESSLDLIFMLDFQGNILEVNAASQEVTGSTSEELIGIPFERLMHPGDQTAFHEQFHAVLEGHHLRDYECRLIHKSGESVHLACSLIYSESDEMIVGVARNITENKQKRAALHQAEGEARRERTLLRALIDSIPDLVFFKDRNFVFLGCNRAFEDYLGISESQLIGKTDFDLVSREWAEYYRSEDEKLFASGESQRTEEQIPGTDGRLGDFDTIKTSFHEPKGESLGLLGVSRNISHRKQMEIALRDERDFSNAVLEGLPGVFYQFESGGRFMRWNENFNRVSGYSSEELSSMRALEFFAEEDHERVAAAIAEAYEKGESLVEADFLLKDGRRIPYLFIGRRFDKGAHTGYVGVGLDISARKLAEEKLKEREALLQSAQAIAQMGSWAIDLRTGQVTWPEATCRLFGITPAEFCGTFEYFQSFLFPEDQALHGEKITHLSTSNPYFEVEYRICRPDGEIRWIYERGSAECDQNGQQIRRFGMVMDITERKRIEDALREKTALFEAQVESSPDGILVVDRKGRKVIQNQCLNELWKIPPHIAENPDGSSQIEHVLNQVKNPEEVAALIAKLEDRSEVLARSEVELHDGTILDRFSSPALGKDGQYYGRLWIFRDVTQERHRERRLTEALAQEKELSEKARAADHAKSEFLAVMSHEIRTPLNGILGFAELLQHASGLNSEEEEYVQIISQSGEALLRLLDDILNYSRLEAGHVTLGKSVFQPRTLLEDIRILLSPQADSANIQLLISCASSVPESLEGDTGRLRQVVLNLVTNALKFTEEGSIHIDLSPCSDRPDTYVFSVKDTGCGIPPEKFDHIFQPFTQIDSSASRRHGGTGLGLAISRRLVEFMGGFLSVESQLGVGSEFKVTLPLRKYVAVESLEVSPAEPTEMLDAGFASKHPLRILIVEDDKINLKLVQKMLRRLGYEPLSCCNGREAVDLFQKESPDFILMDLQMPEMNGIEATREIRKIEDTSCARQSSTIVALTANTIPADRERCFEVGMNDYLNKPVNISSLAKVFSQASDQLKS